MGLTLLIGEGVATVLSAKEATGNLAIAALSAVNLPAVAREIRECFPAAVLVILADLVKATGKPDPHAVEAARAIGGRVAWPDFGEDRPAGWTDFNDLAAHRGREAVQRAIAGAKADRIKRGSIFIPNLCVSIFGGIQPDKLTVYLEEASHALANDGMLQRFQLLVYPDHCPWEWRDRLPDKIARDRAFAVFDALADFDPVAWGTAPADDFAKFPHFRFDEAAQEVFIEWSGDLHRTRLAGEEHPIIAQHLAKFDKLFPALPMLPKDL